jgi:type III restriction enzyme
MRQNKTVWPVARTTDSDHVKSLLRPPDPKLPLRVPSQALGAGPIRSTDSQKIAESRRRAEFITPIPKPKKRKSDGNQEAIVFDEGKGLSTKAQQYDPTSVINEVRSLVADWRAQSNPSLWQVTPETARLLAALAQPPLRRPSPILLSDRSVETAIWLTEVAPQLGKSGKRFLDHLSKANTDANPNLSRLALKLATGAGKTTVMAMLIAWQTINAVRRPNSKQFTRGFLIVAPGLTIKDRLRVLQPNDPDSYYASRELVPSDMLDDVWPGPRSSSPTTTPSSCASAWSSPKVGGSFSRTHGEESSRHAETEGQMIQRVMPDLMGMKNILVLNDEAHHCYREKPGDDGSTTKTSRATKRRKPRRTTRPPACGFPAWRSVNRKLGLSSASSTSRPRRSSCVARATPRAPCSPGP